MAMAKTAAMTNAQATAWAKNFLNSFQNLCKQSNNPTVAELEKIMAHNVHVTSNGREIARNAAEYLNRIMKMRKKYSSFDINNPSAEPLMADNHMVVQYELNWRTQDGQKVNVVIMAMATVEDNRLVKWVQVAHEKNTGRWDK